MMPLWWWNNPPWLCSKSLLFIEIHYSDNSPGICLNPKFPGVDALWRKLPTFTVFLQDIVCCGTWLCNTLGMRQKKADWIASSSPTVQKFIFRASAQNNEEVLCNTMTVLWVAEIDRVSPWNAEINCDGKMGKSKPSAYKPNLHKREIFIEEEMSFNSHFHHELNNWSVQSLCTEDGNKDEWYSYKNSMFIFFSLLISQHLCICSKIV